MNTTIVVLQKKWRLSDELYAGWPGHGRRVRAAQPQEAIVISLPECKVSALPSCLLPQAAVMRRGDVSRPPRRARDHAHTNSVRNLDRPQSVGYRVDPRISALV